MLLSPVRQRSLLVVAVALTALVVSATAGCGSGSGSGTGTETESRSNASPTIVHLANGSPGIGFDDFLYDRATNRLYLPGGRSGNLFEINPATARSSVLVGGFSATKKFDGDHDFGITSVAAAPGYFIVTDRTSKKLSAIKATTHSVVATAKLGAGPDIVRFVPATKQLWVTEPDSEQIEVFTSPSAKSVTPRHVAYIPVKGGPEALVIDDAHGVAYTNAGAKTLAIDLKKRKVGFKWTSGCKTPKELALDPKRNLAFNACNEGGVYAVDLAHGRKVVGHVATGGDVDFPGFAPSLSHLYISSGEAKKVSIIAVDANGALKLLGTVPGAPDSANATADGGGHIWVPRPNTGDVMRITDTFAGQH